MFVINPRSGAVPFFCWVVVALVNLWIDLLKLFSFFGSKNSNCLCVALAICKMGLHVLRFI